MQGLQLILLESMRIINKSGLHLLITRIIFRYLIKLMTSDQGLSVTLASGKNFIISNKNCYQAIKTKFTNVQSC